MKYGGLTLQEIQDLPLSEMHSHLKKYVDPSFNAYGKGNPEKVKIYLINYSVTETSSHSFTVTGCSEAEAEEKAEDRIENENCFADDWTVDDIKEVEL